MAESQRQELVQRLRVRIGPALRGRRAVDALRVLLERHVLGMVAVDLRARSDENRPLEPGAVLEHVLGALHVRQEGAARLLDDQLDSYGGREVEDDVTAVHELADDRGREHGVHNQMESVSSK